ncbi:hypothetical protein [Williamsia serinedens]|uniref:Uncharacterized protein n=1 Tax=Williamsia serinedens TaxID=391736 RepID=A0ABT1H600_9NOCA|nr:hypothetical protein [Williamsia serinedens]MCP2162660.1 hypothetical protein [Williamsia serinedens]
MTAVSVITVARSVLTSALPAVKVSNTLPASLPARCIRISRAGGPRTRELDSPRLLVECFASTSKGAADGPQAEQDACDAYDALDAASNAGPWAGGWITGWDGNNLVEFPDPEQPSHARWQFTGSLFVLT